MRQSGDRPSMFADMIVLVKGIVTVVEQRYDPYSWYMLLVDGGSRICNQIYLIPMQGREVDAVTGWPVKSKYVKVGIFQRTRNV